MDVIYRFVLTLSLVLGLQIHLPVTMFPALDVKGLKEEKPYHLLNSAKYNVKDFVRKQEVMLYGQKETKDSGSNSEKNLFKPRLSETNLWPFSSTETTNSTINRDSSNGLDYKGLGPVRVNPNKALNTDSQYLKGLRDLSESDPTTVSPSRSNGAVGGIPVKISIIQERLHQTQESLAAISNILTENKNNTNVKKKQLPIISKIKQDDRLESGVNNRKSNVKENPYNINTKITWHPEIVQRCTKAFSEANQSTWKHRVQNNEIIKIEEGCGSMQNRLVTFNDSTKACVRYRLNFDLMQGEIYSYYLSKLLKMGYTLPTALHKVEASAQWDKVQDDVSSAKWSESKPLIFTQWIDNLEPVFIPSELKQGVGIQANTDLFKDKTTSELCDLVQWTDLIVFDYMSANLDRVVNNMFNLKWNDKMMDKPIHNLEQSNGAFVFLDNESGLFHGYRLLETHDQFHKNLLKSVCIFTPETVRVIEKFYNEGNIGDKLVEAFVSGEKYQNLLPRISAKNLKILKSRLEDVYNHIQSCRHKYSYKSSQPHITNM